MKDDAKKTLEEFDQMEKEQEKKKTNMKAQIRALEK